MTHMPIHVTDDQFVDALTGNAAFNGVPVRLVASR